MLNFMVNKEKLYRQTLEKYPCITYSDSKGNPINFYLAAAIRKYYVFHYGVERKEHSYKCYPITITEKEVERLYNQSIKDIVLESVRSKQSIEELITKKTEEYEKANEENTKYALETPMEPYYGDPNFIFERSSYILKCIQKLPVEIPNLEDLYQRLANFMMQYGNQKDRFGDTVYPYYTEEYRRDYRAFEKAYYSLLLIEKNLSKMVEKIWKDTLTDPSKHDDRDFTYLIHVFTNGMIPLENMGKVCCSLATEQLLTPPYGNTGIICDFDSEAVEVMCSEDAGSWMATKELFVERLFPTTWQIPNPEGNSVWYEFPKVSKLLLPEDMEREAIEHNQKYNGEVLNYSKSACYSEIFLNSKAKAIGVFYTDECQDTTAIEAYAEKYHLPLIHLSLQKLRENAGMSVSSEAKL